MECISPLKASQDSEGNIVYNSRKALPGLIGFQFECRKCLPCRLNQAREKAVRCYHESKMHGDSIFLTLTYDDEHLKSPKLQYIDFQLFMKSLREYVSRGITTKEGKDAVKISFMVTGEYGEKNKRPHWHALLFNYRPTDQKFKYQTEQGENVFTSETLEKIWKKGNLEYGSLTMDSANYVARYAAKKLVHGKDQEHDFHPIHKTSSRYGIGKPWIEKYWKHTFENGFVVLPNGQMCKIPRYYQDWIKARTDPSHKEYKEEYVDTYYNYLTKVKEEIALKSSMKARKEELEHLSMILNRKGGSPYPKSRKQVKLTILNSKFKRLQEKLKI